MRRNILLIAWAAAMVLPFCADAQHLKSDAERAGFKNEVNMVHEVTRGSHGQVMGYPTIYYYNAVGNYSRVVYCDTTGKEQVEVRYTYDSLGRLAKDGRYRIKGNELISENTYERDRRARTYTVQMSYAQDTMSDRLVYSYDKQGNVEKVSNYDENGRLLSRDFYQYDNHGMVREIVYTEGREENYRRTERFRYDSDGNVTECRTLYITSERQRLCYTYDFDNNGNWVRRSIFSVKGNAAELVQTTVRDIVYFE
ncbi:MAG: hypothetical protein SPJ13_04710 [Bacteroidales bacterium]|nr:hypothetical protein [Bacteroidales bacterium]